MRITPGAGVSGALTPDLCHSFKKNVVGDLLYTSQEALMDKSHMSAAGDPHNSPVAWLFLNSSLALWAPHSCSLESPPL